MKRFAVISLVALALGVVGVLVGCEWNVPNEDTEKENEIDCSQNPGLPGYDCGDACCGWGECGGGQPLYEDYNDCVARCDEALWIFVDDDASYSEDYKICVLDCIADCNTRNECIAECEPYRD